MPGKIETEIEERIFAMNDGVDLLGFLGFSQDGEYSKFADIL